MASNFAREGRRANADSIGKMLAPRGDFCFRAMHSFRLLLRIAVTFEQGVREPWL
jgi:hypothetical protein